MISYWFPIDLIDDWFMVDWWRLNGSWRWLMVIGRLLSFSLIIDHYSHIFPMNTAADVYCRSLESSLQSIIRKIWSESHGRNVDDSQSIASHESIKDMPGPSNMKSKVAPETWTREAPSFIESCISRQQNLAWERIERIEGIQKLPGHVFDAWLKEWWSMNSGDLWIWRFLIFYIFSLHFRNLKMRSPTHRCLKE